MTKPNPKNEIIKREYFRYLREAGGRDSATIDCVAKSLTRFEESTNRRDFKRFHREQAVAFKARLRDAVNARTGERLSKATVLSALRDLRAFFIWLARASPATSPTSPIRTLTISTSPTKTSPSLAPAANRNHPRPNRCAAFSMPCRRQPCWSDGTGRLWPSPP
jgi:site-specific recombinase XerD